MVLEEQLQKPTGLDVVLPLRVLHSWGCSLHCAGAWLWAQGGRDWMKLQCVFVNESLCHHDPAQAEGAEEMLQNMNSQSQTECKLIFFLQNTHA